MIITNAEKEEIVVGPVRLAFIHIWEARVNPKARDKTPKFSARLMFPKANTEQQPNAEQEINEFKQAVQQAIENKFGKKAEGVKRRFKDGDSTKDEEGNDVKAPCPGYWYIGTTQREARPPKVINGNHDPVTPTSGWNAGDWGMVKLQLYPYEVDGGRGVSYQLGAVMFTHKDEAFGGGEVSVDDMPKAEVPKLTPTATAPAQGDDYDPFADE